MQGTPAIGFVKSRFRAGLMYVTVTVWYGRLPLFKNNHTVINDHLQ